MELLVSADECEPPPRLQERLERHLQFILGRFWTHIGQVELRLDRPSTLPEHWCHLVVTVQPLGRVESHALDTDCERAVLRAAERAARRIQYELPIRMDGVIPGVVG